MTQHQPRSRWPAVILIYCLSVASAMVVSEGVPALGGIAAEMRPKSPAVVGLIISIPALVVALAGVLTGWIVDRVGDRTMLLIGGVVLIAGDIGVIASRTIQPLLAWRVIGGIGYLCMAVAAVTMVMRVTTGRQRVAALALWSTVIPACFVAAFLAGALLANFGWRWIFGGHALVSAALLAVGFLALPARAASDAGVSRTAGIGVVLRSPWPYALGASFAVAAFIQTGMIAVLASLLAKRIGATETQVQSFGILAMLFNMGGALAVGTLINRGVAAWVIGAVGTVLTVAATVALNMVVSSLAMAIVADCILLLGCGVLAGMWALLPRVAPSPQTMGATSGLVTQVTLLGVLLGPPAAFAALGFGTAGMIVLLAVLLLGTAPAVPIWLGRTSRDAHATDRMSAAGVVH